MYTSLRMANLFRKGEVPLVDVYTAKKTHEAQPLGSRDRTLILLGKSGVGKSTLLNHIVGRTVVTENGPTLKKSQRVNGIESHDVKMGDRTLRVIDIPGLYHPSRMRRGSRRSRQSLERQCDLLMKDIQEGFNRAGPVVHAVGIVISMKQRLSTAAVQEMLKAIELFGISLSLVVLFFTHGNAIFEMSPHIEIEVGQQMQRRDQRFEDFIDQEHFPRIVIDLYRELEKRVVIVDKEDCDRHTFVYHLFDVIDSIREPLINPIIESDEGLLKRWKQEEEKRKMERQRARQDLEEAKSQMLVDKCSKVEAQHDEMCRRIEKLKEILSNVNLLLYFCYQQKNRSAIEGFVSNSRKLSSLNDRIMDNFARVCNNGAKREMREYIDAAQKLIQIREDMKKNFLTVADRIDNSFVASSVVKIGGNIAAIIEGVISAIGGGLTLGGITAPAGIPLLVIGAVLGVGGALVGAGGNIGDIVVNKQSQKKIEEWVMENNRKHQQLIDQYEEMESMFKNMEYIFQQSRQHVIECIFQSNEIEATDFQARSELVQKIIASWSKANALAIGSQVAGVRTGSAVARGVVGGVEASAEIGATVARTAAVATSSVLIGVSTLFVAADMAMLAKTAYDSSQFNKFNGTKLSRSYRAAAEEVSLTTDKLRLLATVKL